MYSSQFGKLSESLKYQQSIQVKFCEVHMAANFTGTVAIRYERMQAVQASRPVWQSSTLYFL